ncbi:MAG: M48 family metallopeptidase [Opitutaceae bacterium]|nr:M48 family metallopeptidase [Opitutaceae bacterium]
MHPPTGRVRIAAPERMSLETVRLFAISKLPWIRRHQHKLQNQERESPREYLHQESHYLWGQRRLLRIVWQDTKSSVSLDHRHIILTVRPHTPAERRGEVLHEWHKSLLHEVVPGIIKRREPQLGVTVHRYFLQRMKTKWGSCNHAARHIRLNTELVKKPRRLLEYVVVHEMIHLLEPTHNVRFMELLERFMPQWQSCRDALNRLPMRHEGWNS